MDSPLVGIVYVSHSGDIARGLCEVARQMASSVRLEAAGGTDDDGIGTSFEKVTSAIGSADAGVGVVLLCDLGSAILTAETALEFLDEDQRGRVRIVDAPLVEGGVAAAVAAQTGGSLDDVVEAARSTGVSESGDEARAAGNGGEDSGYTRTVTVANPQGLHARPAAACAKLATTFDAPVTINGANGRSLLGIMSLGVTAGDDVELRTADRRGRDAVDALAELIAGGFGEA